jgi:hypothetical protein
VTVTCGNVGPRLTGVDCDLPLFSRFCSHGCSHETVHEPKHPCHPTPLSIRPAPCWPTSTYQPANNSKRAGRFVRWLEEGLSNESSHRRYRELLDSTEPPQLHSEGWRSSTNTATSSGSERSLTRTVTATRALATPIRKKTSPRTLAICTEPPKAVSSPLNATRPGSEPSSYAASSLVISRNRVSPSHAASVPTATHDCVAATKSPFIESGKSRDAGSSTRTSEF